MFLIHRPDGTRVSGKEEGPSIVAKWDNADPSVAHWDKDGIFGGGADGLKALEVVEKTWGPVCTAFYKRFRSWMSNVREDKFDLLMRSESWDRDESDDEDVETLETLLSRREEHYLQVVSIFDEAINALKASPTSVAAPADLAPLDDAVEVSRRPTSDQVSATASLTH